jgi:hypothetical protein
MRGIGTWGSLANCFRDERLVRRHQLQAANPQQREAPQAEMSSNRHCPHFRRRDDDDPEIHSPESHGGKRFAD